jgi:hypothetical protein
VRKTMVKSERELSALFAEISMNSLYFCTICWHFYKLWKKCILIKIKNYKKKLSYPFPKNLEMQGNAISQAFGMQQHMNWVHKLQCSLEGVQLCKSWRLSTTCSQRHIVVPQTMKCLTTC